MTRTDRWWMIIGIVIAVAIGAYFYLNRPQPPVEAPVEPAAQPAAPPAAAIQHPIGQIGAGAPGERAAPQELPPLDASDAAVEGAITDAIGGNVVFDLAGSGDYIRKVVATVDNLPRSRASARLWPVQPTPGRFSVHEEGDRAYLSAENFARYSPFVSLATSVDTDKLVALYVMFYPLFQQAYEDLGYPGHYFNDRVIAVIDDLLATPDVGGNVELVLPPQDPSIEVARPWVLYQYADPKLQSLSAGQKILIRMGSENAGRLKAKLRELRQRLATKPGAPG
jgi:hypothetical protein